MKKFLSAPTCHFRPLLSFPRKRESRGKKCGVTLLEMIVVMAIIIIITAASMPSFLKFINTSRLRAGARDITTALRTARRYAITSRKNYTVVVCMNDLNTGYTPPVSVTLIKNAVTFYETADSVEMKRFPITVQGDEDYDDGLIEITFSPRGNVKGVSPPTIWVENDTHHIGITVASTTGRVKIGEISEK